MLRRNFLATLGSVLAGSTVETKTVKKVFKPEPFKLPTRNVEFFKKLSAKSELSYREAAKAWEFEYAD